MDHCQPCLCQEIVAAVQDINMDQSIKIFPNPASDRIYVSWSDYIRLSAVQLLSIDGRVLIESDLRLSTMKPIHLNVNQLAKGLYFLKLKSKSGQAITEPIAVIR